MSNGSKLLVGKAAEFKLSLYNRLSVGSFCAIYRSNGSHFKEFIRYLFQSNLYRQQISLMLSGSNINNLKPSDIENLTFNIKNNVELNSVLKNLTDLDSIEQQLEQQIALSQQMKQELINKIF